MAPRREGAGAQPPPRACRATAPGQDLQAAPVGAEGRRQGGFSDSQPAKEGAGPRRAWRKRDHREGFREGDSDGGKKKKGFAGTLGETRRIQADEDKTLPQNSPPPNTQIYRRE